MAVELTVALFHCPPQGLDNDADRHASAVVAHLAAGEPPDLIAVTGAEDWQTHGRRPLLEVAAALSDVTGRNYVGELFDGAAPNAVIYDPQVLRLRAFEETEFEQRRHLAQFQLCADPAQWLDVFVEHWPAHDPEWRLARARLLAGFGEAGPTLIAGTLNACASGPHTTGTRWDLEPMSTRDYLARRRTDGRWEPDTRAVDRLIGGWDSTSGHRIHSAGFFNVAELDPKAPQPLSPTNAETGQHTDFLLINAALHRTASIQGSSYQINPGDWEPPGTWRRYRRQVRCTLFFPGTAADGESPL